tara:strand:+ start:41 stop:853 length:813 start_codon:yes stop_codon:yes gene_type:complete
MFLTGEDLFCSILEAEYNAFVALIDAAINFPRTAMQIVKSALQAILRLAFEVIREGIIFLEQEIIKLLDLDDIDLSKTRDNFCDVAWNCAAIKDKIYNWLNIDENNPVRTSYDKFEEIVCGAGLRAILENFIQDNLLNKLDTQLSVWLQDIQNAFDKIDKIVQKYIDYLLYTKIPVIDKTFMELMEELDEYAQCAFAACNWALTSSNKKEDLLDQAGVKQSNASGFVMVLDEYTEFISKGNYYVQQINKLKTLISNRTPIRGVQPDQITK